MTKIRALLAGVVIATLAFAIGAYAQQLSSRTLTGNETWAVGIGGPQGPSIFTSVAQMRNGVNTITTALTTGTLQVPITAGNLVSTAASASLAVTLPPNPYDGQVFEWINGSGAAFTGATVTTSDGSTLVNNTTFATLGAGASVEYRYVLSTTSWYRLR